MLKIGVFSTPKEAYMFYEVNEKGYYRLDFVETGAVFNLEPDRVLFSIIRTKKVKMFGTQSIYDEYLRVESMLEHANYEYPATEQKSLWSQDAFYQYTVGVCKKFGYSRRCTKRNGILTESNIEGNGYAITISVSNDVYDVKTKPLNIQAYTEVTLSKDTVKESTGELFHSAEYLKRHHDIAYLDLYDMVVACGPDLTVARERLEMFRNDPYPFRVFDTETTGLDVNLYGDDHLVGIVLGHNLTTATYFPFRHEGDFNLPMEFVKEIFDVLFEVQDKLIAHNKKFDREVALDEGYDLRIAHCTHQLSIILNPVIKKGAHGLKENIYEITHRKALELTDIFINAKDINFAKLPPEIIRIYACPDGINPLILMKEWLPKLPKYQYKLYSLECRLSDIKADQEYYGIRVDIKKFEHQYKNCNYILDMLITAFRKLTKEDGNINSQQVMSNLLYNKMHCPVLLYTKTGAPSTSVLAIKKLAKQKSKSGVTFTEDLVDLDGNVIVKASDLTASAYPPLVLLAKYKEYIKLKTAFYARFERTMKTGRIFFWVNQNGAATGRQSSPMHQLPPALKDCILSDTPDHDFWGPDYSQIELRMIAYLAGETELLELCKDPMNDIHRVIGSLISGKEMWEITPEERSLGKRRNFGVVYLISKYGLAGQMFGPGYTAENVEFAGEQLDEFFKRFKRINRYIKNNARKVQRDGYMMTAWFNRVRLFQEIFDPNIESKKKSSIYRMANNVPVQGTAADYMKQAEVNYDNYIRAKGWDKKIDGIPMVRLMLSIHDECIISAHNSIPYEEIIKMITVCMEIPIKDAPPFFAQPARMDNWGGHSDDAVAMPIHYRDQLIKDYDATGKTVFKQSFFELQVPEELRKLVAADNTPPSTLLHDWEDKVSMKYLRGDYVTDYTQTDLKKALLCYCQSGTTVYRIDNYIKLLDDYRDSVLHDYMLGLVSKFGMDYQTVGKNVTHPSLTFELLNRYKDDIPKDMEHKEKIIEAARLFIEDIQNKGVKITESTWEVPTAKETDKDRFMEQMEMAVHFDNDGNVIFDEVETELEDNINFWESDDPDDVIDRIEQKMNYVWVLGDAISIDVNGLPEDDINRVLSYLWKFRDDNGFYKAYLVYKGKLIDTKIRIEDIDIDAANEAVTQLFSKKGTLAWSY